MGEIEEVYHVHNDEPQKFINKVTDIIDEIQGRGYKVNILYSTAPASNNITMYSAMIFSIEREEVTVIDENLMNIMEYEPQKTPSAEIEEFKYLVFDINAEKFIQDPITTRMFESPGLTDEIANAYNFESEEKAQRFIDSREQDIIKKLSPVRYSILKANDKNELKSI